MPVSKHTAELAARQAAEQEKQRKRRLDVERVQKRQAENMARGMCRGCGGEREDKGHQRCNKCRVMGRFSQLKYVYGITANEYKTLLIKQNGVCFICEEEEKGKRGNLHVDHCHDTGKIRGLLCSDCNRAIGFLRHSPRLLQRAIEYLTQTDREG